jgi:hypothetical protein
MEDKAYKDRTETKTDGFRSSAPGSGPGPAPRPWPTAHRVAVPSWVEVTGGDGWWLAGWVAEAIGAVRSSSRGRVTQSETLVEGGGLGRRKHATQIDRQMAMYRRRKPSRASQRAVDAGAAAEGEYIMPQSRKARWALWRAIRGDSTGPEIPIVAKGSSRRAPKVGSRGSEVPEAREALEVPRRRASQGQKWHDRH